MRITFRGNFSWKKSSFSYSELNAILAIQFSSINEFKTPATESNFILFLSFCRIGFRSVDMFGVLVLKFLLWIRQLLFQHLETLLSSCLSGLLFSNVYFLDKILC